MLLENQKIENENIDEKENLIVEEEITPPKKKRQNKKNNNSNKEEAIKQEKNKVEIDFIEYIAGWKREYKKVFKNSIDGETIIWRRIKRGEYKDILNEVETDEDNKILNKQERIVETSVLYPFNIKEVIEDNAGLATVLSEEILAKSGFALSYTEEL